MNCTIVEPEEDKRGILELMWGDKKCASRGLRPHEVNPDNCSKCSDFDGEAVCDWHRKNSFERMRSGTIYHPYKNPRRY